MSRHLPILMARFPNKVMLNVNDIASLTDYSKGHIYNLASAKKLPFKVGLELGDRILVSIIEMSDYLDSALLSQSPIEAQVPTAMKRKVGRPRGTTKARLQAQLFQSQLKIAILCDEGRDILIEALGYVDEVCASSEVSSAYREEVELDLSVLKVQLKALHSRFHDLSSRLRWSGLASEAGAQEQPETEPGMV